MILKDGLKIGHAFLPPSPHTQCIYLVVDCSGPWALFKNKPYVNCKNRFWKLKINGLTSESTQSSGSSHSWKSRCSLWYLNMDMEFAVRLDILVTASCRHPGHQKYACFAHTSGNVSNFNTDRAQLTADPTTIVSLSHNSVSKYLYHSSLRDVVTNV